MATKLARQAPAPRVGGVGPTPSRTWWRGLLKAAIGIGGPILLVILFIQSQTPRPDPAPPPVALSAPAGAGEASVELVGSPEGEWTLEDGFLGYRVVEHYPRLREPIVAAGRTRAVEASLTLTDGRLTEVDVRADLRTLDSGAPNRDRAAQVRYLESEDFPWAEFVLTEPIRLELTPGIPFEVAVRGVLTIRKIDRDVTFPLRARWDGDRVQLIGTLPILLSDWGIAAPDIPGYVSVDDDAIIEVDLTFVRP